jgi:ABC-type Na+ transport system ATPase subunit NatA
MLTTLLPPSSGTALIAGFDIVQQPAEVRRHIGYIPQLLSADGTLTGYENMLLSARLYGIPRREQKQRIEGALARMGLLEQASHLAGRYSGGMKSPKACCTTRPCCFSMNLRSASIRVRARPFGIMFLICGNHSTPQWS